MKKNKILGNKLNQGGKNLYTENCKALLKEIKENINKWKDILCSWTGRLNIVKMSTLLQAIYRFNIIHIKIPKFFFFCRNRKKSILKLIWNVKGL